MCAHRSLALFLVVAQLLAFCGLQTASGERIEIVVPGDLVLGDDEFLEGDDFVNMGDAALESRIQWLYPATDFPLPPTTRYVLPVLFQRPDAEQDAPAENEWKRLDIQISETDVDVLSMTFDDNIVGEPTECRNSPHKWMTDNILRPDGTKKFDLAMPFDEPFVFNPAKGNGVLIDISAERLPVVPYLLDWHDTELERQTMFNIGDADALHATFSSSATAVRKFVFYPIGDSNFDGQFDVDDIDLLAEAMRGEFRAMYDIKEDGELNEYDLVELVHNQMNTWMGDANLDGEFNSGDLVAVFTAGEYEDDIALNSRWSEGDWNGDAEFDSADIVVAFTDDGYELGPQPVVGVPEPASAVVLIVGFLAIANRWRYRFWK